MPQAALDLGTANTLVHISGKGLIFNEATAIAFDEKTNAVIAYGNVAYEMVGRNPPSIRVVRPLSTGVISDFDAARSFLKIVLAQVLKRSYFSPLQLVVGIPSRISGGEFKTLRDAIDTSRISKVHVVQEPVAAAIGANLDFKGPRGCLIIDIGAGTTDLAMLSLGRVAESRSLRVGSDAIVAAFANFVKNDLRINIGDRTAEHHLRSFGSAYPMEVEDGVLSGVNMKSGLPVFATISASQLSEAIKEPISLIVGELRRLLDSVQPDLAADTLRDGIYLTGGGSLLRGLPELIEEQTGLRCIHVPDPLTSVATGCGIIADDLEKFRYVLEEFPEGV